MDEDQELIRGINSLRTEVELGKAFGKLPSFAFCLFLFKRVDQFDGREEAHLSTMVFDRLHAKGCGGMGFTRSWATNQHDVLCPIHELAFVQLAQACLVDLAGGKIKA